MNARWRGSMVAAGLILALLSAALRAEVYSANVAIIDGDVVRAREDALREVLRDVALAGEVELRSATALVDQQFVESSLLTSRARLSEFSVVDEEIVGDRLRLAIRVEQQRLPPTRCEPVLWTKNLDAVWQIAANTTISGEARQAVQLFFSGLRESLAAAYPGLADAAASTSSDAPYRLVAAVAPNDGAAGHRLAVKVFGADGTTISAFDDALDLDKLMVRRRESLGYADLTRWVLTAEASAQVERISRQLAAMLRCLPVVVRVADGGSRANIKIDTVAGQPLSLPSIVFYSDVFPVKADGTIDLLALKGALTVSRSDETHLYLQLPKKVAGRPYPSPGAFLWLP
jgi:hypothetical protein